MFKFGLEAAGPGIALVAGLLLLTGCGGDQEGRRPAETPPETPAAAAEKKTEPPAAAGTGSIFGKVTFKGKAQAQSIAISRDQEVCGTSKPDPSLVVSAEGEVRNAVVYIKNVQNGKTAEPGRVTLDQKGCEYQPHVLAFPVGSTVEILNPDGILHNVHTQSKINAPFNLAQPKFKTSMEVTFDKPEIIQVKCDVHPWMSGWFFVAESPYFSVSDARGGFTLPDLPAGKYVVELWHERLGAQTREVQVESDGKLELNFEYTTPAA